MTFQHVNPGEEVSLKAADFNGWQDAARAHAEGESGGRTPTLRSVSTENVVKAKNNGTARKRLDVVDLNVALFSADENAEGYKSDPVLKITGAPLTGRLEFVGVCLEPLAENATGRVQVSGLVVAKVRGTSKYAWAAAGDSDAFATSNTAGFPIFDRSEEDEDGLRTATILLSVRSAGDSTGGSSEPAYKSGKCGCRSCVEGSPAGSCAPDCGCINEIRYPVLGDVRVGFPGQDVIDWEDFKKKTGVVRHIGDCKWAGKWVALTSFYTPEPTEEDEDPEPVEVTEYYRLVIDYRNKKAYLERYGDPTEEEPELEPPPGYRFEMEWAMLEPEGATCLCPWQFKLTKWKYLAFAWDCYLCVTPVGDFELTSCWDCTQPPPDVYEMDVPADAKYKFQDPDTLAFSYEDNRLAGQTIRLIRQGHCDGYDPGNTWAHISGYCPPKLGTELGFTNELDFPCAGKCAFYSFRDETTHVYMFVAMAPGRIETYVSFVDTRTPKLATDPRKGWLIGWWELVEMPGVTVGPGTTVPANWCDEEEYTIRPAWFSRNREALKDPVQHWYQDDAARVAETGYAVTQDDIDEERLFGVESASNYPYGYSTFVKATGTAGSVVWVDATPEQFGGGYASCDATENYPGSLQMGDLVIRPSELQTPDDEGGPGRECGGPAGENCEDAKCIRRVVVVGGVKRWEVASTSKCGSACGGGCNVGCEQQYYLPGVGAAEDFAEGYEHITDCDPTPPEDMPPTVSGDFSEYMSCPCAEGVTGILFCLNALTGRYQTEFWLCGELRSAEYWTEGGLYKLKIGGSEASSGSPEGPFLVGSITGGDSCGGVAVTITVPE